MDEVHKDVDGVGVHSGTLVSAGVENGGADVARDCIWWEGCGGGGLLWVGTG